MAATAVEADTKISNEPKSVTIQVDTMDSGAKKIVVPAAMTGAELISHLIKEGLIGKRVGVIVRQTGRRIRYSDHEPLAAYSISDNTRLECFPLPRMS